MRSLPLTLALAAILALAGARLLQAAPFMIVGNDEKLLWDDNGKPILSAPGKDSVLIVDLANPLEPKIVANLPLKNSVVGPPVNLAIDPTGSVALVADSVNVVDEGGTLKQVPDDKIHVIDLKSNPVKLVQTMTAAKQPSGLSISPKGDLALVANRADKSISVLSIHGTDVKVIDDKVTYNKVDWAAGLWPYNVAVAPSGKIALTADNGGAGSSDGSVDTVSVVALDLSPPRVIDKVVVGDGPEGLAISPKGDVAVAAILAGSNNKSAYYYHRNGSVTVLGIDGDKVTRLDSIEVGGLPEAAVFTPDGRHLYVGNYLDQDFSILQVDGKKITDTGRRFKVPGHPASAR